MMNEEEIEGIKMEISRHQLDECRGFSWNCQTCQELERRLEQARGGMMKSELNIVDLIAAIVLAVFLSLTGV